MDKVKLLGADNVEVEVNVIRFFEMNNNNYLVYSRNEVDEQNNLKLYAVKVLIDNNTLSSTKITDKDEWTAVKKMLETIIKENKVGKTTINDLDYRRLEGLKVTESTTFKLPTSFLELLEANKNIMRQDTNVDMENYNQSEQEETQAPIYESPSNTLTENDATEKMPQSEQANDQFVEPQQGQIDNELKNNEAPEVDYKEMYLQEKSNNEKLYQEIQDIKNKLEKIKEIL